MGNRAIIACNNDRDVGIYLHWNGGPESVLAFLAAAKRLGVRGPDADPVYFRARLTQIIGNFFGGNLSVGIGLVEQLDDSDNGIYFVGRDFQIIERSHPGAKTMPELTAKQVEVRDAILEQVLHDNAMPYKLAAAV